MIRYPFDIDVVVNRVQTLQLYFVFDISTGTQFPIVLSPFRCPFGNATNQKLRICVNLQLSYS